MRRTLAPLRRGVLLLSALPATGLTQGTTDTGTVVVPRIFLDCQASGCDMDFLRTELLWLSFVRDRNAASVYLLVTERSTGGGGREVTVTLQGQEALSARADTVVAIAPQGATQDELRRIVARTIGQGMLGMVRGTPVADHLSVVFQRPRTQAPGATRGARDRWNLWVFRIGANGSMDGDANYKFRSTSGSFRASRTTERWKTILSVGGNYSESHFRLTSGSVVNYQHGFNSEALVVKSLGEHWSFGTQVIASQSTFLNQDFNVRFGPSLEYDVFPYSQSTRHQLVVRYGPGIRALNYMDSTIYDRLEEVRPDHRLVVATDIRRSWGNVGGAVTVNQYLHDLAKRSMDVNLGVRWRIVTGLEFNISGGYSQIRDQIYLPRGTLTDDDVLLRRRQLETGYRYYVFTGLSYTFGSVFNNVVNPRFTQGGGGIFFF